VKLSLRSLVTPAPLGVLAVLVAGAAGGAVLAIGAVYATQIGMTSGEVGSSWRYRSSVGDYSVPTRKTL
jgi:hypothetical protein